jgi:glycerol kinase
VEELRAQWAVDKTWEPQMDSERREKMFALWKKAVTRSFDWVEE